MSWETVRNWYRVRPGYWFRPHLFGYGAMPVTLPGWLSMVVLIAVGAYVGWLAETQDGRYLWLIVPAIAAFIWLAWAKTDGSWRWRWGDTSKD